MATEKRRGKHLELQTGRLQHWLWLRPRWCVCAKDQRKMKKFFGLLMLSALLTGCTTITNLTPSHYPRDPSGYYRVEAAWYSDREAVREKSFKPLVLVGATNAFPMQPVPMVTDRWEAFVPVPADQDMVVYRFKFDFLDATMSGERPNSMMSQDYELRIK